MRVAQAHRPCLFPLPSPRLRADHGRSAGPGRSNHMHMRVNGIYFAVHGVSTAGPHSATASGIAGVKKLHQSHVALQVFLRLPGVGLVRVAEPLDQVLHASR